MKISNQSRVQSPESRVQRRPIADCGLRTVDCGLRTVDCGLRTVDCGLRTVDCGLRTVDCGLRTGNCESGFTLVELLVVISILGILAYLTMPALKSFAKSDATISASRQLLDGVARARQLAISQRTTVYMVFVPTNFWMDPSGTAAPNNQWFINLTPAAQTAATNLCDKQLTGYTFMAHGAMGDQPGNHQWHYLAPWQNLPEGDVHCPGEIHQFTGPILHHHRSHLRRGV